MTNTNHLTDEILKALVEENALDVNLAEVETHIADCPHCQTRLEFFAADEAFIEGYRECLSSAHDNQSDLTFSLHVDMEGPVEKVRSDFELKTIEGMLGEILLPPTHPETMGRLGGYEVEKVIGYGGMGVVLRGYDRELQRPVAIKLVSPSLANDGTAKQRFSREARAAAAILHPNVIAIHGIGESDGLPWFVMPLVNGPTLRELVRDQGPLKESDIVRIGLQLASGLAAAHSHGVIHRDIKPENILVDNHVNRVVITDFGLARQEFDKTLTRTGILAGTLNYMSPEQARDAELDDRSDLFSLGSLLYFLATGNVPFRADSPASVIHKITSEKHRDARELNPEISKSLSATIDTLLEKEPGRRFQSAAELEAFFSGFVSHLNQPTKHLMPRVPRPQTNGWPLAVGIASFALFLLVVWNWLPRTDVTKDARPLAAEKSANMMWAEIQDQYGINSPDNFVNEFAKFDKEIRNMQDRVADHDSIYNDSLEQELFDLARQMESKRDQIFGDEK